jgi:exopolysaccharide biosynthesis protein
LSKKTAGKIMAGKTAEGTYVKAFLVVSFNGFGLIKDGKELTTKGSTGAKTRQAFGYNMTANQYIIVDSQEPREVHDLTVLMKQSGADYAIYTDGGNVNGVAENVNGKKMVTTSTLPDKAMKLHFVPK